MEFVIETISRRYVILVDDFPTTSGYGLNFTNATVRVYHLEGRVALDEFYADEFYLLNTCAGSSQVGWKGKKDLQQSKP